MLSKQHTELPFEEYIVERLCSAENGWLEGDATLYDRARALYPTDTLAWLRETQAEAIAKLEALHGEQTEPMLLDRLVKTLQSKGTLEVLRRGFSVAGAKTLSLCQSAPEDERNATTIARYAANRLRVVRQLKYSPTREWALDLALFVNGIPVATVELKSEFTQAWQAAITQYKQDRQPVDSETGHKHPLLTFKRGALVHFAASETEVHMTTRLAGARTVFLPLNQGGADGGAGNPPASDEAYATEYFWDELLQRDNLLRIIHRFLLLERKEETNLQGKLKISETMIFPRYHQWRAVTRLLATTRSEGPGSRYLIQHSAGSGKTNSISWLSHELTRLYRPNGEKYFNSVIIVTDRTVLDSQLQDAIQQIDHQRGVVCAIDRENSPLPKSQQLAEALLANTAIIIVTLQTFPHALQAILETTSLKDGRYGIIVDEAHTSQTGASASKLRAVLSLDSFGNRDEMSAEEVLEALQQAKAFPANVSYYAFTATPKHSTLTLFGRPADASQAVSQPVTRDNPPQPFDVYSMQQAIEENFILDVLKNYVSYRTAFKLGEEALRDDKRVDNKLARRSLARWLQLHPTNVGQKIEFIVEHFMLNVAPLLGGEAKAMIVTGSRAAAVKYKKALDAYVQEKGYDCQALVAFSGKVAGKDVDPAWAGEEFTEANLNLDKAGNPVGADLRTVFKQGQFRLMIVANKFQTGFDQPKLVAMYLDKKISGVDAVQTLSRLNRTYRGKDRTYVIDFANEPEEILKAFRTWYQAAELQDVQDPNIVYDIKETLDASHIYTVDEVRRLGEEIARTEPRRKLLNSIVEPAADRFNKRLKDLNESVKRWEDEYAHCHQAGNEAGKQKADAQRSELTIQRDQLMKFKEALTKFVRQYEYLAQITPFADPELEAFSSYAKLLYKRLEGIQIDAVDLGGLKMTHYAIKAHGGLSGVNEDPASYPLTPTTEAGTAEGRDREREFLPELIRKLNDLFGKDVGDEDQLAFAQQVSSHLRKNDGLMAQVQNNDRAQAMRGDLPKKTTDAVVDALAADQNMAGRLLSDRDTMTAFVGVIYDLLKQGPPPSG